MVRPAHGRRDAVDSKRGEAARDTGDDAKRNAGIRESQSLLAAATEDEGIAAFEPQHPLALAGELDQTLADVPLSRGGFASALAGEFQRGPVAGKRQYGRVDEGVVDDGIGRREGVHRMDREQAGIARAGADEPDRAGREGRGEAGQGGHAGLRFQGAFTGWLLEFMGTM